MNRDDKARRELYPLIAEAIEKGYADIGCGFDISVAQAITPNIYNALMREGYHRSSDVAREIDDLKRYILLCEDIAIKCKQENGEQNEEYWKGKISALRQIRSYIDAELKKKYGVWEDEQR
jgi:hypothetical protein